MNSQQQLVSLLQQQGIVDEQQASRLAEPASPWWLQLLMALAAWIASLFIISSLFGPVLAFSSANSVRAALAAVLLACALFLTTRRQDFLQHMPVAFALAAQGLGVYVAAEQFNPAEDSARFACIIISTILLASPLSRLHQHISMTFALGCALSFVQHSLTLALLTLVSGTFAVLLWSQRRHWSLKPYAARVQTLLPLLTLSAVALAFVLQSLSTGQFNFWLDHTEATDLTLPLNIAGAGVALLLFTTVSLLSRHATLPSKIAISGFTLAIITLFFYAPALLLCSALLLACFYACSPRWSALMVALQLCAVAQFYYSLHTSLLNKSLQLALAAVVLFTGYALVQRYMRRQA
mgnify:CR=1 FL=1